MLWKYLSCLRSFNTGKTATWSDLNSHLQLICTDCRQRQTDWGDQHRQAASPWLFFVLVSCLCHCLVFLISFINCRHHSLESTPQYGRWREGRGASDYFRICQLSHSSAYPASLTACLRSSCFLYSAPSTTTNVERPMPIEVHWKFSIIAFLTFISDRSFQIGV